MKSIALKFSLAAAHVGEAIRILQTIDPKKFDVLADELRPFVQRIENLEQK